MNFQATSKEVEKEVRVPTVCLNVSINFICKNTSQSIFRKYHLVNLNTLTQDPITCYRHHAKYQSTTRALLHSTHLLTEHCEPACRSSVAAICRTTFA